MADLDAGEFAVSCGLPSPTAAPARVAPVVIGSGWPVRGWSVAGAVGGSVILLAVAVAEPVGTMSVIIPPDIAAVLLVAGSSAFSLLIILILIGLLIQHEISSGIPVRWLQRMQVALELIIIPFFFVFLASILLEFLAVLE
ncbi:MAG: hypothetical protein HC911_15060 [Chloroflexaceae bacterium]|nr:hypothetical protein [Chloroflexaceae bacterium]